LNGKLVSSKNYIIITSCKNEANNLPYLIGSIVSQTIRPILWMIVDDGSTDISFQIIKEAKGKYDWIQCYKENSIKRDLGLHLSEVLKKAFEHAISYCEENKLKYDYLGNIDGDLIFERTFFENLMNEFEKNQLLGIAGGGTKYIKGNQIVYAKAFANEPSGGHVLIKKECFEDCRGFPISYAADSVLKAKANLRGWETRRFEKNMVTEIRDVGSAEGYWKGFRHRGMASYYLNLNPFHVAYRSIIYSFRKPYYGGIAFLLGYLGSISGKMKQIEDEEIKRYFWNKWKEHLR
jgi:glycosyltransferase involved in cell wall biosynthesis